MWWRIHGPAGDRDLNCKGKLHRTCSLYFDYHLQRNTVYTKVVHVVTKLYFLERGGKRYYFKTKHHHTNWKDKRKWLTIAILSFFIWPKTMTILSSWLVKGSMLHQLNATFVHASTPIFQNHKRFLGNRIIPCRGLQSVFWLSYAWGSY